MCSFPCPEVPGRRAGEGLGRRGDQRRHARGGGRRWGPGERGGGGGSRVSGLDPLGCFCLLQGCRCRRCSRIPSTASCRGSTAAAAKLARFSRTRSFPAWRRDSRSSATCPRQSGWSWPRPSACPRRRWAGEGQIRSPPRFPLPVAPAAAEFWSGSGPSPRYSRLLLYYPSKGTDTSNLGSDFPRPDLISLSLER